MTDVEHLPVRSGARLAAATTAVRWRPVHRRLAPNRHPLLLLPAQDRPPATMTLTRCRDLPLAYRHQARDPTVPNPSQSDTEGAPLPDHQWDQTGHRLDAFDASRSDLELGSGSAMPRNNTGRGSRG